MQVLDFRTITSLASQHLPAPLMVEWVEAALTQKATATQPAKTVITLDRELLAQDKDGFYDTMPVVLPAAGYAGTKLVDGFPQRTPPVQAAIALTDLSSGALSALVDGTWITVWRTGAVAAHSALLFARTHPLSSAGGDGSVTRCQRIGIVGLGNTAAAMLAILAAAQPDTQLEVQVLRYKDTHEAFAARFADTPTITITPTDSLEELCRDKDLVVNAASAFDHDVVDPDWFAPGVTVIPIYKVGFNSCNPAFDRILVDDRAGVEQWEGIRNAGRPVSELHEVAEVVTGAAPGRTATKERIIVHNLGIAVHDVYWASQLLELAHEAGMQLPQVGWEQPEEKFWA